MGWFDEILSGKTSNVRFSSPSGDGLVHMKYVIINNEIDFRPRLGMGWFLLILPKISLQNLMFSSPSGDGLVHW